MYTNSSPSAQCMYKRQLCCQNIASCTAVNFSPTTQTYPGPGFFNLDSSHSTTPTFQMINSQLSNYMGINNPTLVNIDRSISTITLQSCTFLNIFFPFGIMYMKPSGNGICQAPVTFGTSANIAITITSCIFNNYNPTNVWQQLSSMIEGFILNIQDAFQGSITISNSNMVSMEGSYNRACLAGTLLNNINFVNTNFLDYYDPIINQNILNPIQSTALYICALNGPLTISNNTFSQIIGYSGSVIALNQYSSQSTITIENNQFTGSKAIVGFPNIRIYNQPAVKYMFGAPSCQMITMTNNTFSGSGGCPGAYGNVLMFCDPGADTIDIDSATPGTGYGALYTYATSGTNSVTLTSNTFNTNYLSGSNGVMIYGHVGILIQSNTFSSNGVSLGQFIQPQTNIRFSSLASIWFTHTSPVYISLSINVAINDNNFNGNWAVIMQNFLTGSQITLDALINLQNPVVLNGNTFNNNIGIPSNIQTQVEDNTVSNVITNALISINLYSPSFDMNLTSWQGVTISSSSFESNFFDFQYTSYNFDHFQLANAQNTLIDTTNPQNYQGVLRMYDTIEKSSSLNSTLNGITLTVTYQDDNFDLNNLTNGACLFSTSYVSNTIITGSTFNGNSLSQAPGLVYVSDNYSMLCSSTNGLQYQITSSTFSDTLGRTIYIDIESAACNNAISITSSSFTSNSNTQDSTILASALSAQLNLNILLTEFANNYNTYGCIYLPVANVYSGSNNTFSNNTGQFAVAQFMPQFASASEIYSIFQYNTYSEIIPSNPTQYGILYYITPAQANVILTSVSFINNTLPANSSGSDMFLVGSLIIQMTNCTVSEPYQSAYSMAISGGFNVTLTSNTISVAWFSPSFYIVQIFAMQLYDNTFNSVNTPGPNYTEATAAENYPQLIGYISEAAISTIVGNTFADLNGQLGIFINIGDYSTYSISSCSFSGMKAWLGSALYLNYAGNSSFLVIANSTFTNNKAVAIETSEYGVTGFGGAIYYVCATGYFCNFTLQSTYFSGNVAESAGGGIYIDNFPPFIDSMATTFGSDNQAPHGPLLAGKPIKLMSGSDYNTSLVSYNWAATLNYTAYVASEPVNPINYLEVISTENISALISGGAEPFNITFVEVDLFGQIVTSDNSTFMTVSFGAMQFGPTVNILPPSTLTPYANLSTIIALEGVFYYNQVIINFWPNSNVTAYFTVGRMSPPPSQLTTNIPNIPYLTNSTITYELQFRDCIAGESFRTDGICESCSEGFYLINIINDTTSDCIPCQNDISICLGASAVFPKPGYWRKNITADIILPCPNTPACVGLSSYADAVNFTGNESPAICETGYSGNLCDQCPVGWAQGSHECIQCAIDAGYWVQVVFVLIGACVLVIWNVYLSLEILEIEEAHTEEQYDLKVGKGQMAKIMVSYVQFFSIISQFQFNWPFALSYFSSIINVVVGISKNALNIDCAFVDIDIHPGADLIFVKVIFVFATPWIMMVAAWVFWRVSYKMRKLEMDSKYASYVVTSCIVIGYNLQPNILSSGFSLFQCQNFYREDTPEYFLQVAPQIQCFTSNHLLWSISSAVPNLSLWCVVLPYGIFRILQNCKKDLHAYDVIGKYSFFYIGFKREYFYWEFIIMTRKFLVISVFSFLATYSQRLQAILLVVIVALALMLQIKHNPHRAQDVNRTEQYSLVASFVTSITGLYFLGGSVGTFFDVVFLLFGIVANILFFLYWFRNYFKMMHKLYRGNKWVDFVSNQFQRLKVRLGLPVVKKDNKSRKDQKPGSYFISLKNIREGAATPKTNKNIESAKLNSEINFDMKTQNMGAIDEESLSEGTGTPGHKMNLVPKTNFPSEFGKQHKGNARPNTHKVATMLVLDKVVIDEADEMVKDIEEFSEGDDQISMAESDNVFSSANEKNGGGIAGDAKDGLTSKDGSTPSQK